MSDRLTDALRADWGAGGSGPDLVAGLDTALEAAVRARSRRRRTLAGVTTLTVLALAALLTRTPEPGDRPPALDAVRAATGTPPARAGLPTLPRLPAGTLAARHLTTSPAPGPVQRIPTLPRRPARVAPPRPDPVPAEEARS
ncbi:MAG: hypothetical protein V2J24_11315 [Pseudomonadales bacterium]|jgi:hypothetical protein|nr:hypothetical protein [Pseudomonadales bacterium]